MIRRLVPIVLALILVLAACTSAGTPNSYEDQDKLAQRNFREACEESVTDSEDDPPSFCECAFFTVASQLTIDEFLDLGDKLSDDPEALSQEERTLFNSVNLPCGFTEADIDKTVTTS